MQRTIVSAVSLGAVKRADTRRCDSLDPFRHQINVVALDRGVVVAGHQGPGAAEGVIGGELGPQDGIGDFALEVVPRDCGDRLRPFVSGEEGGGLFEHVVETLAVLRRLLGMCMANACCCSNRIGRVVAREDPRRRALIQIEVGHPIDDRRNDLDGSWLRFPRLRPGPPVRSWSWFQRAEWNRVPAKSVEAGVWLEPTGCGTSRSPSPRPTPRIGRRCGRDRCQARQSRTTWPPRCRCQRAPFAERPNGRSSPRRSGGSRVGWRRPATIGIRGGGQAVEVRRDVACGSRVAVGTPGAADAVVALEEHDIVEAILGQADGPVPAHRTRRPRSPRRAMSVTPRARPDDSRSRLGAAACR